jgi:hypothetical protein
LVALAVFYHLSRPGAELDPETLSEYEHGLAEVLPLIDEQNENEVVGLELTPLQVALLSTAMSSVVSELKMYSVFDTMSAGSGRPRSAAPGFDQRLRFLFPEVAKDPANASVLAEDMTLLRRELPSARAREVIEEEREEAAAAQSARRRWWQFWRRA